MHAAQNHLVRLIHTLHRPGLGLSSGRSRVISLPDNITIIIIILRSNKVLIYQPHHGMGQLRSEPGYPAYSK